MPDNRGSFDKIWDYQGCIDKCWIVEIVLKMSDKRGSYDKVSDNEPKFVLSKCRIVISTKYRRFFLKELDDRAFKKKCRITEVIVTKCRITGVNSIIC